MVVISRQNISSITVRNTAIFFTLSLSCLCAIPSSAQQVPYFSQWYYNKIYYNTAFAPLEGRSEILATYRSMWSSIEGAPHTAAIIGRMPLFSSQGAGSAMIGYDRAGGFSTLVARIGYAYSLQIGKSSISIGLTGGITRLGVDDKWNSSMPDDPYIPTDRTSSTAPQLGVGIAMWSKRYYIGLSSIHTLEFSHNLTDALSLKQKNHIFFMGGYSWDIGRDISLCPSGLLGSDMTTLSLTANLSTIIKRRLIAGLSYGNERSFGINVGYIWKELQVNYCYQTGISGLASSTGGSHEVLLIYRPSPKERKKTSAPPPSAVIRDVRFL